MSDVMIALEIMLKGMAGIFVAVLIIMALVYVMGQIGTGEGFLGNLGNFGKKDNE